MPRNHQLQEARNLKINEEYKRLSEIRKNGVAKYRHEYILTILSEKFFLAEITISWILKGCKVQERNKTQKKKKK